MNENYKPYRLINTFELQQLTMQFNDLIKSWNEAYVDEEISCEVNSNIQMQNLDNLLLINQQKKPIALVEPHYLSFLKNSIFRDDSPSFDPVCHKLFMELINQLFKINFTTIVYNYQPKNEWIYRGSACLNFILKIKNDALNFYLHPSLVLDQLSKNIQPKSGLSTIKNALASQKISLKIEFEPLKLPVHQLLNLQIGSVIKTDHCCSDPLLLKCDQKIIAAGKIGQCQHHKSIQLSRIV